VKENGGKRKLIMERNGKRSSNGDQIRLAGADQPTAVTQRSKQSSRGRTSRDSNGRRCPG